MPNKDLFGRNGTTISQPALLKLEFNLGGKTSRLVASARKATESARMARGKLLDDLLSQGTTALNNLSLAYKVTQTAAREYDISQRKFNLAGQRRKAGQLSVNRLLELEADLTALEQQYHAATIRYYLAETDYLYAIGSSRIYGGLK